MKKHHKPFIADDEGYFTLEATLVFPIILLVTFFMVFILIWFYQSASFQQQSVLAVERTAHHWGNSHTSLEDGSLPPGEYDDLYWRTFDQFVISGLGLQGNTERGAYEWGVEEGSAFASPADTLTQNKLARSRYSLGSEKGTGALAFQHRLWERVVQSEATRHGFHLTLPYFTLPREVRTLSSVRVSEPVEFTRNLDLLYFYFEKLRARHVSQDETADAFERFTSLKSQDVFFAHDDEADAYLRELVGGSQMYKQTSYGQRTIDALDQDQVAHQAFLTTNATNLREVQMPKDAELLNTGQVRGVIWHFFKHANPNIRTGPSNAIRDLLRERGIVVVIHD